LQTQKYHDSLYLIAVKQFHTKNHNFTSAELTRAVCSQRDKDRTHVIADSDARIFSGGHAPPASAAGGQQQHGRRRPRQVINRADILSAVVNVYLQLGG